MKKYFFTLLALFFTFLVNGQQGPNQPLGHFENLYLGMSESEFEDIYKIAPITTLNYYYEFGKHIKTKKFGIVSSEAIIDLKKLGKTYKADGISFTQMKLYFFNKQLLEIKFLAEVNYVKLKVAQKAVSHIKAKYARQYKGLKEFKPNPKKNKFKGTKDFKGTLYLSSESLNKGNISKNGNVLQFNYGIDGGKQENKYHFSKISLRLKRIKEISFWIDLANFSNECMKNDIKPISSFRGVNLGMNLNHFKEEFNKTMIEVKSAEHPLLLNSFNKAELNYIKVYTLQSSKLSLLSFDLEVIYYIFYEDKLNSIQVILDKNIAINQLKVLRKDLIEVYGKPFIDLDFDKQNPSLIWHNEKYISFGLSVSQRHPLIINYYLFSFHNTLRNRMKAESINSKKEDF